MWMYNIYIFFLLEERLDENQRHEYKGSKKIKKGLESMSPWYQFFYILLSLPIIEFPLITYANEIS